MIIVSLGHFLFFLLLYIYIPLRLCFRIIIFFFYILFFFYFLLSSANYNIKHTKKKRIKNTILNRGGLYPKLDLSLLSGLADERIYCCCWSCEILCLVVEGERERMHGPFSWLSLLAVTDLFFLVIRLSFFFS